jgi:hypothetical protein
MSINNKLPLVAIRPSWGFSEVRRGRCAEDELINSRKSVICQQGLPPPAPPVAFWSLPPPPGSASWSITLPRLFLFPLPLVLGSPLVHIFLVMDSLR